MLAAYPEGVGVLTDLVSHTADGLPLAAVRKGSKVASTLGDVVEGRRDPDAASSARGGPSRAAEGSFAFDMAGPGVAGGAGGDGAGGAPGGDAADRHSRHDLALAARRLVA